MNSWGVKEKVGTTEQNYNGGTDIYKVNSWGVKEKVVTVEKKKW